MNGRFSRFFSWIIIGFALGIFVPNFLSSFTLKYLLVFYLFLYIDIYIHEFGHAIAGAIVQFRINKISIGTGRQIFKKRFGNFLFVVTDNFSGGMTHLGDVPKSFLKLRYLIFVMGGVIAQSLAVLIALAYFNISFNEIIYPDRFSVVHIFIHSNLVLIAINLIPHYGNLGGMKYPTDGLQILKTPFLKAQGIQEILSAGKIHEGHELYQSQKYSEAETIFRECTELYPKVAMAKVNLVATLLKQSKPKEAQAIAEAAVKDYLKHPQLFILYNNLAYAYFLQLDQEVLHKGEHYSLKALELNSKHPAILGTRGCILIEQGKIGDGLALLKQCANLKHAVDERTNPLGSFTYMAYGHYLNGNVDLAFQYLNKVEAYDKPLDRDYQTLFDHVIEKTTNFGRTGEPRFITSDIN